MKKIIPTVLLLIYLLMTSLPATTTAFSPLGGACGSGSNSSSVCQQSPAGNPIAGPNGILNKIINILSMVIGIAAVFAIAIAGLQYTLSGGDSAKINNAKNAIIFAIVGLIVVALSQLIEAFIIKRIT